jgi:tetratricopeptide (TPR) repeat protein
MQPQWRTLREIWPQYRQFGSPDDLAAILAYASQAAQRETEKEHGIPPATLWHAQASMHMDVGQTTEALSCLNRAYAANPHNYQIRYSLGKTLLAAGRPNEAEPHVRWCMARRPEDKWLGEAIASISKLRFAEYSSTARRTPPLPLGEGGSRSEPGEGVSSPATNAPSPFPLPRGEGSEAVAQPISR